jgi:hypothetical protein
LSDCIVHSAAFGRPSNNLVMMGICMMMGHVAMFVTHTTIPFSSMIPFVGLYM